MFTGITPERVAGMNEQERRWLHNARKAFFESDCLYRSGTPENGSVQHLCRGIEVSWKLRLSLIGKKAPKDGDRRHFVAFVRLDAPDPQNGGLRISVFDCRTQRRSSLSFAKLAYLIRTADAHENENLNVAEFGGAPVLLDWNRTAQPYFGTTDGQQFICDGHLLWNRLRELLAKFLTGLDTYAAVANGHGFAITVAPPLGSIAPDGQPK